MSMKPKLRVHHASNDETMMSVGNQVYFIKDGSSLVTLLEDLGFEIQESEDD